MNTVYRVVFVGLIHASFCVSPQLWAASACPVPQTVSEDRATATDASAWTSGKAQHVYGFSEAKPHRKGTLTLSAEALRFSGKWGSTSIPRGSVTAVSAGNERVEIWGVGGRLLRMAMQDGGGLAAATVMHHRIDMLTVEYRDGRTGEHSAVFFLPAREAERALESFALAEGPARRASKEICQAAPVEPGSVLVSAPNWDQAEVPAAYRALVYERAIDRLGRTKGVGHVYREGEGDGHGACPQYRIQISIAAFKEGSSVQRAFLGPAGMFVGTTQMEFDIAITSADGKLKESEQIKATIRGESESTNVADRIAKNLAKRYAAAVKKAGEAAKAAS